MNSTGDKYSITRIVYQQNITIKNTTLRRTEKGGCCDLLKKFKVALNLFSSLKKLRFAVDKQEREL